MQREIDIIGRLFGGFFLGYLMAAVVFVGMPVPAEAAPRVAVRPTRAAALPRSAPRTMRPAAPRRAAVTSSLVGLAIAQLPPPDPIDPSATDTTPTDVPAGSAASLDPSLNGNGGSVHLGNGSLTYEGGLDLDAYNPVGPSVGFRRVFRGGLAIAGYGSPGLSAGWTHNYDIIIQADTGGGGGLPGPGGPAGGWTDLAITWENGASETLDVALDGNGDPTGVITPPAGSGFLVSGDPGANDNEWDSVTLTWPDQTVWTFTEVVSDIHGLTTIADRMGNAVDLSWTATRRLSLIEDEADDDLLAFTYDLNGRLSAVVDNANRKVLYAIGTPSGYVGACLLTVSQVVSSGSQTGSNRVAYDYETINLNPMLNEVTVPSPTGTGDSVSTYDFNNDGQVTTLVDPNGNQTVYTYAASQTTVEVKDSQNTVVSEITQTFDGSGRNTGIVDAEDNSSSLSYGDNDNPLKATSVTTRDDKTTTTTYDDYGQVATVTDPRGITTTTTRDYNDFDLGRVTEVEVEGIAGSTSYEYYEPSGLIETVTSPAPGSTNGTSTVTTTYTYDSLGNPLTVTAPGNDVDATIVTTFEYETDGQYSQDAAIGQPLTVTDNLGHVTHFRYDVRGRKTSVTDALGNTTEYEYNLADQATETTLPATGQTGQGNATVLNTYQYVGGPLASTARYDESASLVRTITYTYGDAGELLSRTGSAEAYAQTYDAAYRVVTYSDGEDNATEYTFDIRGDLTAVEYPNGDTISYASHDAVGRVLSRTDGRGIVTSYTYGDEAGLLTAVAYTGYSAQNVALTYDDYGRLTQRTDGAGGESYAYDDLGNVLTASTTYTGLAAKTLTYTYFADGSRDELDTPGGDFEYGYDAGGRLTSLVGPEGTAGWSYDNANRLTAQTLPNGFATHYTLNAWGLVEGLENEDDQQATLSEFDEVEYDGVGNLTSVTSAGIAAGVTEYSYDSKDQLTNETTTRGDDFTHSFAYDDAGNPTTFEGSTRTYNEANQRTGAGFAYDDNGNPTTYNTVTCTYDVENHLTAFGDDLTAGYRGDGKRAWKQDDAEDRTYYLYDGDKLLAEMDEQGSITAVISWGAAGLFAYDGVQYQFDVQGNVVARTTAGDAVLSTHWFDAHGTEQSTPTTEPFGYKGRWGYYTDRESGLVLCTHRYLDPEGGRWLTRDPISYAGGVNLYSYCCNQSATHCDPSGLDDGYHPTGIYPLDVVGYACDPMTWIEALVFDPVVDWVDACTSIADPNWIMAPHSDLECTIVGMDLLQPFFVAASFECDLVAGEVGSVGAGQGWWPTRPIGHPSSQTAFRNGLGQLIGPPPPGGQAHHVFPQSMADAFADLGIDVWDPHYGTWWPAPDHQRWAHDYNEAWRQFFGKPEPTAMKAFEFARELNAGYGLKMQF